MILTNNNNRRQMDFKGTNKGIIINKNKLNNKENYAGNNIPNH